jgi:tetratricopeptide (TPR) repeat protein
MTTTVLVALAFAPVARAQSTKIAAEALFEEGRRLVAEGKFAEACPKFESSQQIDPTPGTMLNLANCYEKSGKTATAWASYKEAASLASAVGRADYVTVAQKRAAALAPGLARVTLNVASPAEGTEIKRDGAAVGRGEWGVAIPVDPGAHTIEAAAPRRKPWSTTVEVAKGASVAVAVPPLEVQPDAPGPVATGPGASPATEAPASGTGAAPGATTGTTTAAQDVPPSHEGNTQRTIALITLSAGIVGAAVGTVFVVDAKSKYDDSLQYCPKTDNACTPQGVSLRDDARAAGNAATVGYAVGITALAAGAILYFTAPKSHEARQARMSVVPTWGGALVRGIW